MEDKIERITEKNRNDDDDNKNDIKDQYLSRTFFSNQDI